MEPAEHASKSRCLAAECVDESNTFPSQDEWGVDLRLIDLHLSLTPAERLRRLEEYAEFILTARRANGIREWSASQKS